MQHSLQKLLTNIITLPATMDCQISGMCSDSRLVAPGDVFVATVGEHVDGRKYIEQAITKGAVAVLCEENSNISDHIHTVHGSIPIILIPKLEQQLGKIATRFYANPSSQLNVIGITGTNGKTTCSHLLAQALTKLGQPCGIIGTLGNGFFGNLIKTPFTTPDAILLQKTLAELLQQGASNIAMEVSSHGLQQGRVNGIQFDTAIFTNLSRDHLDYHGTMEKYAQAKAKLFAMPDLTTAILNADDAFGQQLLQSNEHRLHCYAYSLKLTNYSVPLLYVQDIKLNLQGIQASLITPWGQGRLHSSLLGMFNVQNLLAVTAALCNMQVPLTTALECLADCQAVAGRMQALRKMNQPTVVVDYAHSPDALQQVLQALRSHCEGELWCVFGCGGDRDKGKRPQMGKIASTLANHVVVTNDNPRSEDPRLITDEIADGIVKHASVNIIHDRAAAITYAVKHANKNDMILVAGKGHEDYQIIGEQRLNFSDIEFVKEIL